LSSITSCILGVRGASPASAVALTRQKLPDFIPSGLEQKPPLHPSPHLCPQHPCAEGRGGNHPRPGCWDWRV